MTADELEYQLWQYAEGSLPADDRAAVEAQLASDPMATSVVAEYRRLDGLLAGLPAVPAVDWDALAGRISAAVGEVPSDVVGRIGFGRAVRRSAWWGGSAAAAAAAMAVGLHLSHRPGPAATPAVSVAPVVVTPPTAVAVVEVSGPRAEAAAGPAVADVSVGPSPAVDGGWRYADGVGRHQPKIVLAGRVRAAGSDFVPAK